MFGKEEMCLGGDVGKRKKTFDLDLGPARVQIAFVIERASE